MSAQASVARLAPTRINRAIPTGIVFALLAAPVAAIVYLLTHPSQDAVIETNAGHFYIVTAVCVTGFIISGGVTFSSFMLREARVFFLNLGFLSISGIFLVHALATPGFMMAGPNPVVGLAARLSLFVGSVALAMSAVRWRQRANAWIVGHWKGMLAVLAVAWIIVGTGVLVAPQVLGLTPSGPEYVGSSNQRNDYDYGPPPPAAATATGTAATPFAHEHGGLANLSAPLSSLMAVMALALFGFAGARYYSEFRLAALPAQAALVIGIVLLAEAQLPMWLSRPWTLSWWGYHVLMLAGFLTALAGFAYTYVRKRSLAGLLETLYLTDTIDRVESSYSESLFALVAAVEARDEYTKGHSARVSQIAVLVGEAMRLPGDQLRSLGRAGLVHDVGKLSIPDQILGKPGPLTDDEYAIVKQHPMRGYDVVKQVDSLRAELPGVLHHHEWFDGRGYPFGVAGEMIPLQARILSVADVYDALTSVRPYRPARTSEEAVVHLRMMAGTQFDPACVAAFLRIVDQWRERRQRMGM